jgi:hypothetical protein
MATTELSTEQEETWRAVFDENHADLVLVADMLMRCHLSPERIIHEALSHLESSPYEATFEHAIQAVVDMTVQYNRESANLPLQTRTPPAGKLRVPGISQIAALPWSERAVYFLRGILRYSCEETGLLLNLTEVQIDQLYEFAVKRLGYQSKTISR